MIVGVHGIRCYRYLAEHGSAEAAAKALAAEWAQALGAQDTEAFTAAYYAPLLHRGTGQGEEDPEQLEPEAQQLLIDWVTALGAPAEVTMGRATLPVRQSADWMAARFGSAARVFAVLFCREVATYISDPDAPRRAAVREAVLDVIEESRPEVVIAHSLGSVVTYEALWHRPVDLDLLVTLGSPLGMPNVIFERLSLGVGNEHGRGQRPPGVRRWINIADAGDVIAIPRDLRSRFPGIDEHFEVSLGILASHRATRYLGRPEVVREVEPYLTLG